MDPREFAKMKKAQGKANAILEEAAKKKVP
jgi:hypothetical protein